MLKRQRDANVRSSYHKTRTARRSGALMLKPVHLCFSIPKKEKRANALTLFSSIFRSDRITSCRPPWSGEVVTLCVPNLGNGDSGNCMYQFPPNISVFFLPLHLLSFILWEPKSHIVIMRLEYTMLSRCLSWKTTSTTPGGMPDPNSS